jgi:hypothetical protein
VDEKVMDALVDLAESVDEMRRAVEALTNCRELADEFEPLLRFVRESEMAIHIVVDVAEDVSLGSEPHVTLAVLREVVHRLGV